MATYTKGGSTDEWIFPGSLNVTGTLTAAGTQSIVLDATEEAFDIDAGTTDHTGANIIDVNLDVNSSNCKVINMDIDVGTALNTGEKVYGTYVNIDGAAGDHADSEFAAFYATSANTTASTHNNGVELGGTFDTGILVGAITTADGISLTGTGVDGLHISGAQSANAIHISGDQAVAMLVDVDADLATGISYSVDTGKTVGTGISMTGLGTVTTGINFAPEAATTGISVGLTGKTYTTGIACGVTGGTLTTGIDMVGATTTGISITGATSTAISTSGTSASATGRVLKGTMTVDAANYGDGYGLVESELTLSGTVANHAAALTAWINIPTGTTGANYICAQSNGLWADTASVMTGSFAIFGMRMQCLLQTEADLAGYWPFSIVNNTNVTTALIMTDGPSSDIGLVTNAGVDAGTLVPLYSSSGGVKGYVKIYTLA